MKRVLIADKNQNRLASHIAQSIGIDLIEIETVRFADTEIKPLIDDNNKLSGSHVIVVHSTSRPVNDQVVWLLLVCDILRLKHVKKISAIIPYFGYGRQDTYDDGLQGAGFSVMRMLESAGIGELITIDLHVPAVQNATISMKVHNITLGSFIAEHVVKEYEHKDVTIVAPDKGSYERAAYIARYLSVPLIKGFKERIGFDNARLLSLSDACKTERALIVDDIIDTGTTVLQVAQAIRAGNVNCKTDLFAIHPVLSNNAVQLLQNSFIDRVWVTDSIELYDQQLFEKLRIVNIGSLLVKALHDLF